MPVPDQVRDYASGIQNILKVLDSSLRWNENSKEVLIDEFFFS